MRRPLQLLIGLSLAWPCGLQAKPVSMPLPTREELREIQLLAYSCSRENQSEACERTRTLTDPRRDHPRLPASCKDTLWELLQVAKVVSSNSFQRRDSIDRPARRLTVVCGNPVKPVKPATPPIGGFNPNQT